jgi:hypothetical protein
MIRSDVRLVQVALTGTRLALGSDEELLVRLKSRFKLSEVQAAAMLKGRCIVKRGIDAASARKLAALLCDLGLQAVIEEMPPPAAALRESASKEMHRASRDARTAAPGSTHGASTGARGSNRAVPTAAPSASRVVPTGAPSASRVVPTGAPSANRTVSTAVPSANRTV